MPDIKFKPYQFDREELKRAKRRRLILKWLIRVLVAGCIAMGILVVVLIATALAAAPGSTQTPAPQAVCRYSLHQRWTCERFALGPLQVRFVFWQPMSAQANLRVHAQGKLPAKGEILTAMATLQHRDTQTGRWVNVSAQNASDKHVASSRRVSWSHVFRWKHLKLAALYRVKLTLTLVLSNSPTAAAFAFRLPLTTPVIFTE